MKKSDFLGILYNEEEGSGEYTCVERVWRMEAFPDREITEMSLEAWEKLAGLAIGAAEQLGAKASAPMVKLRDPNEVRIKIFPPDFIKANLEAARSAQDVQAT